jgi:hypothetical protein
VNAEHRLTAAAPTQATRLLLNDVEHGIAEGAYQLPGVDRRVPVQAKIL